jgi:hypothetical protein
LRDDTDYRGHRRSLRGFSLALPSLPLLESRLERAAPHKLFFQSKGQLIFLGKPWWKIAPLFVIPSANSFAVAILIAFTLTVIVLCLPCPFPCPFPWVCGFKDSRVEAHSRPADAAG